MQVLSFVQGELAQVPKDGFTDILVKDSKVRIQRPDVLVHAFLISEFFILYRRKNSGVRGQRRWTTPKSFLKTSTFSTATFRCAFSVYVFVHFVSSVRIWFWILFCICTGASPLAVRNTRRMGTYFTLLERNSGASFLASRPLVSRIFHTDESLPLSTRIPPNPSSTVRTTRWEALQTVLFSWSTMPSRFCHRRPSSWMIRIRRITTVWIRGSIIS